MSDQPTPVDGGSKVVAVTAVVEPRKIDGTVLNAVMQTKVDALTLDQFEALKENLSSSSRNLFLDLLRNSSVATIQTMLDKYIEKAPERVARTLENRAIQEKHSPKAIDEQSSLNFARIIEMVAPLVGLSGAAVFALWYHQNPTEYFGTAVTSLVRALQSNLEKDYQFAYREGQTGLTSKGFVQQQHSNGYSWINVVEVTFTRQANKVAVSLGQPNIQAVADTAKEAVGGLSGFLNTAKNVIQGRADLSNILAAGAGLLGETGGDVLESLKKFFIKLKVWQILDDEARPYEEEYWSRQDDTVREQRALEVAEAQRLALKSCPGCGNPYSGKETACISGCNLPRTPESLEAAEA